jgi:two-component system NarL family response regulator
MKVLLADDHPLFVDGLRNLLLSRGIDVVGTARDGLEALERARALRPDVVLMDINMPRLDGLGALRLIKHEMPEIKVIMLTMSGEGPQLFEAIKIGASGYLLKTQDTEDFFKLLERLPYGEAALQPGLTSRILDEFKKRAQAAPRLGGETGAALSPREMQVITLVAEGLTYKEVGARLFLSERTIKYHMGEIFARLNVENRAQAVDHARRAGIVS